MKKDIQNYISKLDNSRRKIYKAYWTRIKAFAPELEKGINYGVPSLRYKKYPVLGVAIYKDHVSLFPNSAKVILKMKKEFGELEVTKLLVIIKFDQKISDKKIKKMISLRKNEIDSK
jgi:uncharacterized protein YdhG (YjbR/CyaY superfamily)